MRLRKKGVQGCGDGDRTYHWIARSQHDELSRMDDTDTLTLHCIQPTGGTVQNKIHQTIV